ncbi:MAG: Rieske 2Fe-2S domain-containing protein [Actinomycetota bacterium]|nr:Rieske 2Fe-2S domain-containing protein [Actinomycetota bacterium]
MSETVRLSLSEIAPGTAKRLDAGPDGVCVVRIGNEVYAIGDRCSHANVSLSEGDIDEEDRMIECWKHGSAFSLSDGEPQSLPATKAVPVYDVTVDGDVVVVTVP